MFNTTAYGKRQLNIYRQLDIQVTLGVPAHLAHWAWVLGPFRHFLANWGHLSPLDLLKFQKCQFLKMYSRLWHVA